MQHQACQAKLPAPNFCGRPTACGKASGKEADKSAFGREALLLMTGGGGDDPEGLVSDPTLQLLSPLNAGG